MNNDAIIDFSISPVSKTMEIIISQKSEKYKMKNSKSSYYVIICLVFHQLSLIWRYKNHKIADCVLQFVLCTRILYGVEGCYPTYM